MFSMAEYVVPENMDKAYRILIKEPSNTIIAGTTFLRMGLKKIGTAIDLSKLGLNYIRQVEANIEIGAMTNLRDLEVSELLKTNFSGILPKSIKNMVGVQFRNHATIGATVYSRYSFSSLIPSLMSINAQVVLHKGGRISLEEFMTLKNDKDILEKIILPLSNIKTASNSIRNSFSDYPILNVAVSNNDGLWKIVVGARPGKPVVAINASAFLTNHGIVENNIEKAARLAVEELRFGSNMRASSDYRRNVCEVLVRRAIMEVIH